MERRGFLGAVLTGAAASLAGKAAAAAGQVEEIERKFIVPTDIARELEEAKEEAAVIESLQAPVVRDMINVNSGGRSWYNVPTPLLNKMPDDTYLHFVEEHRRVNERFGFPYIATQSGHPQHRFDGTNLIGDI